MWTPRYFHGTCVTEGTKRRLHLAPRAAAAAAAGQRKRANPGMRAVVTPEKKPKTTSPLDPDARRRLEGELRRLRTCFAAVQGCEDEEYRIFPNKSLHELIARLPRNRAELMMCWGIKERRCDQYGGSILAVIDVALRGERGSRGGSRPVPPSPGSNRSPTAGHRSSKAARNLALALSDDDDDDDEIETGPSLSVEEMVRQRVREAEARGEVFEIL